MDKIEIKGYKSFRNLTLDLLPICIFRRIPVQHFR